MSVGTDLLDLQELDLALARSRAELADMPEIKALARKRKAYLKLKDEALRLMGRRKDLQTELADLDEDEVEQLSHVIQEEIGQVFAQVLEDCAVFADNLEGRRAFARFIDSVQ